ncbi:putative uncharacterized protein [Pseudarthrobacter siccitolerans]|uniref:PE-PPE domain-containing protein n=1 Tax=Pseudarthrobacter siccitolerans TaxID=861266 RepID=A0A024H8F2_9MICC|nr:hypothetical protein [Pseudarthrobacter siccitolerans]CCQ48450.1 putative uncharacterized protein [Pseudarthrobacter siccitolerans]
MAEVMPSGSGLIKVSGPPDDGFLTIRGGVGGIRFQLEELGGGAEKLDDLAGELSGMEVEVRRIWEDLVPFQDLPRWSGSLAMNAVGESERSIQAVRTELQRISGQVRACKQEYEVAEAVAGTYSKPDQPLIAAELEMQSDFWRTGFLNRTAVENLTALAVHATPLAKMLVEAAYPGMRPRPVEVQPQESIPIDFDPSPAGLLERIRLIDARGAGFIEVVEVENAGQKAYVVVIPGTQLNTPDENPFGLNGIVEGVGNSSGNVSAAVLEALKAAGAQKGATVVGVGYSQGGLHAMNLAANEEFLRDYDLKYVLTAGSPVAGIRPDTDVSTLHLEHRTDWVPGTDGAPNRDSRNQVTATMNNDFYVQTGENVGIGPGHQLTSYQDGARLVSASSDPSLVASTAALGAALGAGGTATATRFSLSRTKAPAANLHAADNRRQERGYGGR